MQTEHSILHQYELGPWDNLMYLIEDKQTSECAVIDPAWDINVIEQQIKDRGLKPTHCVITHNHYDHVNMLEPLLARYPEIKVFMLDVEIDWSNFQCKNLVRVSAGDTIKIGANTLLETYHTPGHSPGSMSLQLDKALLTGDALFINSCGRSDFVGGDTRTLYKTINWFADTFADDIVCFPGHGSLENGSATMESQRKNNPYMLFETYEEFEAMRMDGRTPGSPMPEVSEEWKAKVESLQPAST